MEDEDEVVDAGELEAGGEDTADAAEHYLHHHYQ